MHRKVQIGSLAGVLACLTLAALYPHLRPVKHPEPTRAQVILGDASQAKPSKAFLEIETGGGDQLLRGADGTVSFKIEADSLFPEDPKAKPILSINTVPALEIEEDSSKDLHNGRKQWSYKAVANSADINLVKIKANLCASTVCNGPLDKLQERVVDVGTRAFDKYIVKIHPADDLVSGRTIDQAFVDFEVDGHVLRPTSNIKLHLSAPDGCVSFASQNDPTSFLDNADLVIDADRKMSQTGFFAMRPAAIGFQKCAIAVAVYDDEKQRDSPVSPILTFGNNMWMSIAMCCLGGAVSTALLTWRKVYRGVSAYFQWLDFFEYLIKASLSVIISLVLTSTDFIGVTVDKSSPRGFFTTGFLLGFIPLDNILDAILKRVGVGQGRTPDSAHQDPTASENEASVRVEEKPVSQESEAEDREGFERKPRVSP
jgi:hypothetical protein